MFLLRSRGRACQKMDPKSVPHMAQFLLPRFAFAAAAVQTWSRFLGMRAAPWLLLLKHRKNSLSAFDLKAGLDALQRPSPVDATAGHALAKRVAGATALSTAASGQPLLTAATTARGGGRSRSARKRQTDLRQDAIEDLRGQREQLRTAARKTLRRVRNAEKRRNRVLTRLWNLYATSVLAVLMDRDSGPSAAPASAARGRCSCSRT